MEVNELTLDEYADALPSTVNEVFHRPAALRTVDRYADADLRCFAAQKGQQTVGLLPVFVSEGRFVRTVMSPPPSLGIPHMGPLVFPNSPKRSKVESVNGRFTEGVLAALDADDRRTLSRLVCGPGYDDPRPFEWNGFTATASFTYCIDASDGLDDVRAGFSRSLRRELGDAEETAAVVERGNRADCRFVYEDTAARYAAQDEPFGLSWGYVRDLTASLGEHARTYVARAPDGERLTGVIVLYSDDRAYFWLGGTRSEYEGTSLNALLHWRVVEDLIEDPPVDGVTAYDLMGANTERLCEYKAKFGGDLVPYYTLESEGPAMAAAKRAYDVVKRLK